ncbi:MAG TPA: biopolymer transporter ExbD [Myxococcaceae bacterium]|nr:biopolymer transporter ExbD [Myxococcaceae bacterium]
MAVHLSRRKLKPREPEEMGELNLVPYLDILMNLIIFMLMSITGLAAFGVLNVSAPAYGSATAGAGGAQQEEPFHLSIQIGKEGFYVSSNRAILGQAEGSAGDGEGAGTRPPTIPLKADGTYDFEALNRQMIRVKDAFPQESQVILVAEPAVSYDTLVQVMDAVRETQGAKRRLLFPDVNLGEIIDA